MVKAEVISVGDELTSGQRLDTNTQWLSLRLGELGVATVRHTTVGDDLSSNIDAFALAAQRADIVVVTGGLGPTLDDLTRQAMAEAFDAPLELDVESLKKIELMFAQRNREMPERNRVQAMFPRGSRVIPNPHGSAPGIDMTVSWGVDGKVCNSRIFALPGVPAEMKQMWFESVVPRLEQLLGTHQGPLRYHTVKLFGIGESDVEVRLPDLIHRGRQPTVGITVSRATITLRIAGRAHNDEQFAELIAPTLHEIQQALGELIFGEGELELEHVVLRQLVQRQLTMACVEIGTASWISHWLLSASTTLNQESTSSSLPARTAFQGGIAFPTLDSAQQFFCRGHAQPHSPQVRESHVGESGWSVLASQARQHFAVDRLLVVGCYPSETQMEKAVAPFDFTFAIADHDGVLVEHRAMGGHPDVLGPRVAKTGLDLMRKQLGLARQ